MNILIIGKPFDNLISLILASKTECKIITAENSETKEYPNITFDSFDELIQKALALKIDIALNLDKHLIEKGLAEAFYNSKINLISVNKKWLNLETSKYAARKLLLHYSVNTPQIIRTPLEFPVIMVNETTGKESTVESLAELTELLETEKGKLYYEEPLNGEEFDLLSLWDGKNILYLSEPPENEVKSDRLDLLKTKINFMLSDEKADFRGFFTIRLIWTKNDWYIKSFDMNINENTNLKNIKHDFMFILNALIYQNLDEI